MGKRAKAGFQIGCAILLAGCSTAPVVPKGETTLRGRGAQVLTERGDPMMQTGEARKVPAAFAAGYAKGISDQAKRSYWQQQDDEASASQAGYSDSGKVKLYDVTVPEHRDGDGVIRVERRVKIPMIE